MFVDSGFPLLVVLGALQRGGCSSSESVGNGTESTAGSNSSTTSHGGGGAGGEGGQAGASRRDAGGAAGSATGNPGGNNSAGANAGGNNDAGPSVPNSIALDAGSTGNGRGNKILIYTKTTGFRHASIPAAAAAISKSAIAKGLVTEQSEDTAKFVTAELSKYAAVILLATSGEPLGTPGTTQIQTLIDYVKGGGGLVAIEDANHTYDTTNISLPYISLIGGDFTGHSGSAPTPVTRTAITHRLPCFQQASQ